MNSGLIGWAALILAGVWLVLFMVAGLVKLFPALAPEGSRRQQVFFASQVARFTIGLMGAIADLLP